MGNVFFKKEGKKYFLWFGVYMLDCLGLIVMVMFLVEWDW